MKSIVSFILCMVIYYTSVAQKSPQSEYDKKYYLHKSKVTKTIGYGFLATGGALLVTGGIIDEVKKPELLAGFTYQFAGLVSALASIPFFISSSKNKRKALSITLNTQKTIIFRQTTALQVIQPVATIKIIF